MNGTITPTTSNPPNQLDAPEAGKLELAQDFNTLEGKRNYMEDRLLDYAGWTLPYLYLNNETEGNEQQHDYQAVGAQAVNHLANKIVSVLFPQGRPFFRYELSQEQKAELQELNMEEAQVDAILSLAEKEAMKGLAKSNIRTVLLEALKHLIVLGNTLLYLPKKGKAQIYSLKDYVILRDMSGTPYKMITRDAHVVATLPEDIKTLVRNADKGKKLDLDDTVFIYTGIQKMPDGRFKVWQEIDNLFAVPRNTGMYTPEDLPWIPLAWNLPRGYNYGFSLVQDYAGDFHTLSSLSEALVNLASIVSDIKILVDPMGSTDVGELNDTESGTYVFGNADDISYLQLEKFQDLKFLHDQMETYARRIAAGFLLSSAAVRDSERTTAEEIRMLANELEGSLGGIYGRLSEDLQIPLARHAKTPLGKEFKDIEPTIITGMESLSRNTELDDMLLFLQDAAGLAELPDRVQDHMKFDIVLAKLGAGRRVDYDEFLFTAQEAENNKQKRMEQENPQQPQPAPEQEMI